MRPILYIAADDRNLVIADYSGSQRHKGLSKEQWIREYQTDPSYASMRVSYPNAVPDIRDVCVGEWKKDWSGPYVEEICRLVVESTANPDFDGIPFVSADGASVHTLRIRKVDLRGSLVDGSEDVRLIPSIFVRMPTLVKLSGGRAEVTVGPSTVPGSLSVSVFDVGKKLSPGTVRIRFL